MEENRRFSWTDLFIKVILIVIFVLFTVWLLSLSNKGLSNSLDVLTDNIFAQNIEKMKEVGKEYFTIERLPEKIGEIETLTLKEMYEKNLILEVKDKNGNACNAKDSYVSIEKMENEYQMKVNLECGKEKDYIIVIMGCYNYCDTDICEKKDDVKEVEYEYKKTTGGKWTDYGNWSEWSKVSVTNTDYRQVETKKVNEEYTYNEVITNTLYEEYDITCPSGYSLNSDKTKCYKAITVTDYQNPTCSDRSNEGYKLIDRDGFTCTYSKEVESKTSPVDCPVKDGWEVTRDGLTCTYEREVQVPYQTTVDVPYQVPYRVAVGKQLVSTCSGCGAQWQTIYETRYRTEYKKETVTNYRTETETETSKTTCPTDYEYINNECVKKETVNDTKNAVCSVDYKQSGNKCIKETINYNYDNIVKSCPVDYKLTSNGDKCYKNENTTIEVTDTREVTYYRYRVRQYVGGNTDYKWSKSNNDKDLLNAGYKLTGRTR